MKNVIIALALLATLTGTATAEPTECKAYNRDGKAQVCPDGDARPMPSVKWSYKRMKREGLGPVWTAPNTLPMVCPCHAGQTLEEARAEGSK